ncbi:hypothetical protein DFJ74DRAFT_703937 [Hyaloraphidium curvatum]|nr:hypothetical protein DFJ74DRAFT_703937 [Hyaloraphidium curvatum]
MSLKQTADAVAARVKHDLFDFSDEPAKPAAPKVHWPSTPFKVPVEESDLISLGIKWEPYRGTFPDRHPTAVRGGWDDKGRSLFVARGRVDGNVIFGKAGSMLAGAAFGWHNREHMLFQYEVLTAHPDVQKRLRWVKVPAGPLKNLAGVFCGGCKLAGGERVFCGRRVVGNSKHIGFIYSEKEMGEVAQDGCSIGFDGRELHDIYADFEVLVVGALPTDPLPAPKGHAPPAAADVEMGSLEQLESHEDEHEDAIEGVE